MATLTFRRKLANVIGIMAFIWSLILVGALAFWGHHTAQQSAVSQVEARLEAIALSVSTMVDGDVHARIISEGSEANPDFIALVSQLKRVQAANSGQDGNIAYIYTFWREAAAPTRAIFGLDSGEGADHSPINTPYEDPLTPAALSVFETGQPACDPIDEDSFGIFKTAYAPIRNSRGETVAIVGVDLEAVWPPLITPEQAIIGLIVVLISTLLGIIIAHALSPAITKPLDRLTAVAMSVSSGNLREDLGSASMPGEFVKIGTGFQKMIQNLRKLVGHIRQGADQLKSWSDSLHVSTEHSARASGEITRMLTEVAGGSDSVATSSLTIAEHFKEVDQLAVEVSERVFTAGKMLNEAKNRADSGTGVVSEAVAHVHNCSQTLNRTSSQVGAFREWSGQIAETAGFIANLAEQINMLAMNAQIEAARAGEFGLGFAVVAQKVSSLSDDTALFAEKITTLNREISARVDQVGSAVSSTDLQVAESASLLDVARQSFLDIAARVHEAANMMIRVAEIGLELKNRTQIGRLETDTIAAIMEETSANLEQISAGSQEQAALSSEAQAAARKLHELADLLVEEVRQFKL